VKILRAKKKCGKCEYLADFPHVHCTIGCKLQVVHKSPDVFHVKPKHPLQCTTKRQFLLTPEKIINDSANKIDSILSDAKDNDPEFYKELCNSLFMSR